MYVQKTVCVCVCDNGMQPGSVCMLHHKQISYWYRSSIILRSVSLCRHTLIHSTVHRDSWQLLYVCPYYIITIHLYSIILRLFKCFMFCCIESTRRNTMYSNYRYNHSYNDSEPIVCNSCVLPQCNIIIILLLLVIPALMATNLK